MWKIEFDLYYSYYAALEIRNLFIKLLQCKQVELIDLKKITKLTLLPIIS